MTTTSTGCEVLDQLVMWADGNGTLQVFPGDLVLIGHRLEMVAAIHFAGHSVLLELDGWNTVQHLDPAGLVAVRRYIEGEK